MPKTVRHANIESRTARSRHKRGRQPHWRTIIANRAHLGYQRQAGAEAGRWLLRRYTGEERYSVTALGTADDVWEADGERVLNFDQAHAAALAMLDAPKAKRARLTVRQAVADYVAAKEAQGQPTRDLESRMNAHVIPTLGDKVVADLTAERLRRFVADLATKPALNKPEPKTEEEKRKRRASANRILSMVKAALNHAYDEGHVSNREAWGRRLKPFENADAARIRYLSIAEAKRLINACNPDFRRLVQAALVTGARYGQLIELTVDRFNPDAGTLQLRTRKGRGKLKVYNAVLTDEGRAFFEEVCAGRAGHELMFRPDTPKRRAETRDENAWCESDQVRAIGETCGRAKISPPLGFHQLRHTWASHAVMNGVPLMVVAQNLGHTDTRMIEKHYGHLAPSFVADAIRKGAPQFGFMPSKKLVPLRR